MSKHEKECCQQGECAILKDLDERIEKNEQQNETWRKILEEYGFGSLNSAFSSIGIIVLKQGKIEKVLQDMLETKIENAERHLKELIDNSETDKRFIDACQKQIDDANRQLKKLSDEIEVVGKIIDSKAEALKYYDLGMVFSNEEGILEEYVPSQFVRNSAKKYRGINLTGFMIPESEERKESQEKPTELCTLEEQDQCYSFNTICCLNDKITTCVWGKKELEKHPLEKDSIESDYDPELKYPFCQTKWISKTFYAFDCPNCNSEIQLNEIYELIKREFIEKLLKRLDWILERISFHTENPDSELMDEIREEYNRWEKELKKV